MRRWIRLSAAVALVLGVAIPASAELIGGGLTALPTVRVGPNLVSNGGFDSVSGGLPASWSVKSGWAMDQLVKHSGAFSFRRSPGAPTASQTVFVRKGVYDFSAWIRTSGIAGSGNASMRLQFDMRPTVSAWTTTDPIKGTADWQFYEIRNIVVPQDLTATLKLESFGDPGGTAWFDDVKLIQKLDQTVEVFMLYPNFRGMMFDDQSRTLRFEVKTHPPAGTDHGSLTVTGRLKEEATGRVIATRSFTGAPTFEAQLDGSLMQPGLAYLAEFSVNSTPAYTYPAYRVSRVPASARQSMNIAFDDDNRLLIRGQRRFLLGVYDSGGGASTDPAYWERNLFSPTGFRRLEGLRVNFYLNYWLGTSSVESMNALMGTLQKRGIMYLQTGNCFDKWAAGSEFVINSSDTYVQRFGSHPGSAGYYTVDECRSAMVEGAFAQYTRLRRLDPDSMTFSTLFGNNELELWKDAVDVLSTDPYPLWGAEPAGGYEHKRVADWTLRARAAVRDSRPVMAVLQFLKATSLGRWPTRQEMRNHAYMAIVEGATGLWWWSAGNGVGALHNAACVPVEAWCPQKVALLDNLKAVVAELADLEPVLIADDASGALRGNSNPSAIRTKAKIVNGKGYLFAYNYTNARQTATLTWNTAPGTVTVHNEGRTLAASGTSFTDTFGPYQAHVYFLGHGGTGGTPPPPPAGQAPAMTFVNPAAGATVSGTVTVTMSASGGSGSGYTYRASVDGNQIYAGTNASFSWNTTTVANGARTLTATVTDSTGQTSTQVSRTLTVGNGGSTPPPPPPPTGTLDLFVTAPKPNATLSGSPWVVAWLSGTTSIRNTYVVTIGGVEVGRVTTASRGPVTVGMDLSKAPGGRQTLVARATDAAGKVGVAEVAVNVAGKATTPPPGPPPPAPPPPGPTPPPPAPVPPGNLKVMFTAPKANAVVRGSSVLVAWLEGTTSTSNTYTVTVGGVRVASVTTASRGPVSISWSAAAVPAGIRPLTVTARDATGRTAASTVNVRVMK